MTDPAASRGSVLVRLAREPLVHFLLLGGLLFLVYARIDLDEAPAIEEIVIDESEYGDLFVVVVEGDAVIDFTRHRFGD